MDSSQFVFKRIVSTDGKTVAEVKSFAKTSGDGKSEITQSLRVKVSSNNNDHSSSQSGHISISCTNSD